jgi:hypothetical protein
VDLDFEAAVVQSIDASGQEWVVEVVRSEEIVTVVPENVITSSGPFSSLLLAEGSSSVESAAEGVWADDVFPCVSQDGG